MNIKKYYKKIIMLIIAVSFSLFSFEFIYFYLSKDNLEKNQFSKIDFLMGTYMDQTLYNKGEFEDLEKIASDNYLIVENLDLKVISWRSSESIVHQINNRNKNGTFKKQDLLNYKPEDYKIFIEVLKSSIEICKDTNGELDVTMNPIIDLWGIENSEFDYINYEIPSQNEINTAMEMVGYENIKFIENDFLIENGRKLNFGAFGKGFGLDLVKENISKKNISGAIISIGGSVLVYGNKPDNSDWKIGIRDPKGNIDDVIGYIKIKCGDVKYVSTSGGYEKNKIIDNKYYHHIISGNTGMPIETDLESVTVVSANGLISDGLSTACFLLGYEDSIELLKKNKSEAVFIYKDLSIKSTSENMFEYVEK